MKGIVPPVLIVLALLGLVVVAGTAGLTSLSTAAGAQYGFVQYATVTCLAKDEISVPMAWPNVYKVATIDTIITSVGGGGQLFVNGQLFCSDRTCIGKALSRGDTIEPKKAIISLYGPLSIITRGMEPRLYYRSVQYASTDIEVPYTQGCTDQVLATKLASVDKALVVKVLGVSIPISGGGQLTAAEVAAKANTPLSLGVGQLYSTIPEFVVTDVQPSRFDNGVPQYCNPVDRTVYGYTGITLADGSTAYVPDRGRILYDGRGNADFACSITECISKFGSGASLTNQYICKPAEQIGQAEKPACQIDSDCSGSTAYSSSAAGDFKVYPFCAAGKCSTRTVPIACNPLRDYSLKVCVQTGADTYELRDKAQGPTVCPAGMCCDAGNKRGYLQATCSQGYECIDRTDGVGTCRAIPSTPGTGCPPGDVLCSINQGIKDFTSGIGVLVILAAAALLLLNRRR
jgi:hypothetical protein